MTTELLLVRHGESEWNRLSRYAGQRDVPLSAKGKQQAQRIAERLHGERLTAIYSSPLQRARETAHAIAARHCLPVTMDTRLVEIHHGLWQDLTTEQVQGLYPAEHAQWQTEPHRLLMPQGESLADVARRACEAQSEILARHPDGQVVICSHDAVVRVLLLNLLDLGLEHFWKWHFANASLTILQAHGNGYPLTFRLALLNDTVHLRGVESEALVQAL